MMKNRTVPFLPFLPFLVIMIWAVAALNVSAQEEFGSKPAIFDIQRLEKLQKESFADFLLNINERDIFSSPKSGTPGEIVFREEEVVLPQVKLIYRGKLESGKNKVAMIEVTRNKVKKNYFLKKGESAEDFRVVDIQKDFVVICGQEEGEKKLYFSGKP